MIKPLNPLLNNTGCNVEVSTVCAGNTRLLRSATAGVSDIVYSGAYGKLQAGATYSYTQRYAFSGVGGAPHADESVVLTSLRHYPF